MKSQIKILIVIALCLCPLIANAGIVNNTTPASGTAEDSVTFTFTLLDTLGNSVARTTGDSLWVFTFYPGGGLAASDSARILSDAKITYRQTQMGTKLTATYAYSNAVGNLDGAGENGTYAVLLRAYDSSLALTTDVWREFQLYTTNNISLTWDSTTQIPTGEITTGSFTAGAIDAAAIAPDAIGASELATGAITTLEWAAEADNNGINWADITNATAPQDLSSTTVLVNTTSINEIADTTWRQGISQYRIDANFTTPAWKDSIMAAAFVGGAGSQRTAVRANIDSAVGDLSAAQIETDAIGDLEIADGAVDWGGELDTSGVYKSTNDSMTTSRLLKRNWGVAAGLGADSTTVAQRTVTASNGLAINLDLATGTLANSQVDDDVDVNVKTVTSGAIDSADFAADLRTLLRFAPWEADTSNAKWNDNLAKFGEWNAQAQAATGGGGANCGAGSQTVTLCALDTSGVDAFVQGAQITLHTSAARTSASIYASMNTLTGGCFPSFNLNASTVYYYSVTRMGYVFDTNNFTTGSGGTWADTLYGYDVLVPAPSVPNLCRLQGNVYDPFGQAVQNAIVKVCPDQAGAARAGTTLIVPKCKSAATSSLGAFTIDVIMSDSLVYSGGDGTFFYNISVSIKDEDQPGVWNEIVVKERVRIPTASSYRIDLYVE